MAKREIIPIPSIEEAIALQNKFYELCEKLLDETDYALIRGVKFRKRSGWAKLRRAIGISTKVTHEKRFETKNTWGYYFRVRAELPSGRYEEADGACSAKEFEIFDIEPTEHLVRSKALTRAKNRATSDLIAAGEVTYEEIDVREGEHWIDDAATRKRFWGWARKSMGLTSEEVHEALGVEHIRDFEGTFHEAKQRIVRWVGMKEETLEKRKAGMAPASN